MVGLNDVGGLMILSYSFKRSIYIQLHQPAIIIAGCFAAFATVLSIFLISQHLHSYTNPAEQKWIVAVLFMVPVYATESIISLSTPKLSLACDILRNCYEAFALYSFGSYLVACLGGERSVVRLLDTELSETVNKALLGDEDTKSQTQQSSLRKFIMRPYFLGRDLLSIEKFGLVQYMILKTLCAFLALVLELCGVYGDGEFKWYYGYPYLTVVLNFSQMWALYCLVQFYHVTYERLQPINPLAKFISFKAIVFATWWQGVGIALLCAIGVLPKEGKFQTGLQDFLICIEMAIAAVAHISVFSAKPYQYVTAEEYGRTTTETMQTVVEVDESGQNFPAVIEKSDTKTEAPGTSIKESVQDIVVGGGQHVVKDVVLTINLAMQPVEKGMTKIHEKIQHISVGAEKNDEATLDVEEHQHMEGDQLIRNESIEFHEEIVS